MKTLFAGLVWTSLSLAQTVPADQPATLDYFMADYVDHLHHHLRQIAAATGLADL